MRRGAAWLLAGPLILGGSQFAHAIAYRIAYPQAHVRVLHMLATGHSYFTRLPLVLAAASACVLVSLVVAAIDAARGRPSRSLPAWAFALLPPLAFALQEVLELSLHTGTFAWRAVLAPTFVPGLLLQLPVALLMYAVARLLLRAAERIGLALAGALPRPRCIPAFAAAPTTPIVRLLAGRRLARAPPRIASSLT
ncbi:MAG TPA: hypothetical protein VIE38_07385 [Gaiellaceae bacterium]|jgi:hypothetical protein